MPLEVWVVTAVFLLIAVRQVARIPLGIWQIMTLGALCVLASGRISPAEAIGAVDADVMLFLFGMFVVGHAIEESGYLERLAYRLFRRARSPESLLAIILAGSGALSAVLMNDTLAIVGTPVVLLLAKRHEISPKLFLLGLAFGVTTGSVMSPIGNPQNLLIALRSGMPNPFPAFFLRLALPTLIGLAAAFAVLRALYHPHFGRKVLSHDAPPPLADARLAALSKASLTVIFVLIGAKAALGLAGKGSALPLTAIALAAAAPVLIFSPKRLRIVREVDWHTLIFFAAMFVLMESAWRTGWFQDLLAAAAPGAATVPSVLGVSVALSQLISNVPLVAMYLPLLNEAGGESDLALALAAGSTIAGNLFILGAASNVIIIQNAERRSGETVSFLEFARAGVPLTVLQAGVYWLFLSF